MALEIITERTVTAEDWAELQKRLGPSLSVPDDLNPLDAEAAIQIVMLTSGATRRQAEQIVTLQSSDTSDAGQEVERAKADFPLPSGVTTQQAIDALQDNV